MLFQPDPLLFLERRNERQGHGGEFLVPRAMQLSLARSS